MDTQSQISMDSFPQIASLVCKSSNCYWPEAPFMESIRAFDFDVWSACLQFHSQIPSEISTNSVHHDSICSSRSLIFDTSHSSTGLFEVSFATTAVHAGHPNSDVSVETQQALFSARSTGHCAQRPMGSSLYVASAHRLCCQHAL